MAKGLSNATAVLALLGFAPWAVYLGGLAKLTDVLTDFEWERALQQTVIMLEWYIVSSQFVNLIFIAIVGFASGLHRFHSIFAMFLAVASTLLILQATSRIQQINALLDNAPMNSVILMELAPLLDEGMNPLPYLRVMVAGQIASATWNFFLAILISFAGTEVRSNHEGGPPPHTMGAIWRSKA